MTCRECKFSRMSGQGGQVTLDCRFNPPEVKPVPQQHGGIQLVSMWPPVDVNGWCGKFEQDNNTRNSHA